MKIRNLLLALLTFCFFNPIHAEEQHLDVRCLITNEEGIFLQVGDRWIAGDGLLAISGGTFVLCEAEWIPIEDALSNPDCARATWVCSKCKYVNYEGILACAVCGKPRHAK